ncbi:hypothetical protein [Candidatus Parabeggiatoa sp. HSG14]|uniref:hypothetical protein n=1 Tax=Candidatus Parabeggiatoa sp. HSG14 TaxID=3055593 RepID=UPI0025A73236|nr:hypothetical protein [Thiotrichales bacterium HSG14]
MKKLFSNNEVAEIIKIPASYMDELLIAAKLVNRGFDHYGLCHHSLSILGNKFGRYNGTEVYNIGKLLDEKRWIDKLVEFDIIVWHRGIIPYLEAIIEKDMLDYNSLDNYYQYIGNRQYSAGRVLKVILEMRRPATMSFQEMMVVLKSGNYNDFDDEVSF